MRVESPVAITLMASVIICILNAFCTITCLVCVSLLLQKQPICRQLQSLLMVTNYIPISLLAGNELIKQFTTKHILQTHKEANITPHKTHTSATLTSNTFHHSICTIVSCFVLVTVMKVRTEIKHLAVLKCCHIYCIVQINCTTPKSN